MPRKPKRTVRINHSNLLFTETGVIVKQGTKEYDAKVVEIDDQEYFTVLLPTGHKVWIEIDYSEKTN